MPNDEARLAFPKILSYYMDRDHIDQTAIAERLHVSKQIVSDWVRGKKFPRVNNMQMLAEMFGVLLSDMYTYDKMPSSGSASDMCENSAFSVLSAEELFLLSAWRAADDRAREDALNILLAYPRKKEGLLAE